MRNATKNGLMVLIIGSVLTLASAGIQATGTAEPCLGGIGTILAFIGIIMMVLGRSEFDESHKKSVMYGLALFIISFMVAIVAGVMIGLGFLSGGFGTVKNGFYIIVVSGILGILANFFLVYRLEDELGKKILYMAVVVSIIFQSAMTIMMVPIIEDFRDEYERVEAIENDDERLEEWTKVTEDLQEDIGPLSVYGIPGSVLFLLAFIIPYNRINKGELKPKEATPTQYQYMPQDGSYPCLNCGKPMYFDPKYERWYCNVCDKEEKK